MNDTRRVLKRASPRENRSRQGCPRSMLHPSHDSKRGDVVGIGRIGEVAHDPELEHPLAVGLGVALALAGGHQRLALRHDRGRAPAHGGLVELPPVLGGDRRRAHERQPRGDGRDESSSAANAYSIARSPPQEYPTITGAQRPNSRQIDARSAT